MKGHPMDDTRVSKSATELAVGDWLAPGELLDGAAEVLHTLTYRPDRITARDDDKHVHLVVREQGKAAPWGHVVGGDNVFDLATKADLAELREKVERAKFIEGLRFFAAWLEANPWAPIKRDGGYMQTARFQIDLHGDDRGAGAADVARVCEIADRFGVKAHELDDRTDASTTIGAVSYSVIAWHKDGRPAEPVAPVTGRLIPPVEESSIDPDSSMEAHYDAEMDAGVAKPVHMDLSTGESMCGLAATTPHKGSLVWVGVTCKDCNNEAPF